MFETFICAVLPLVTGVFVYKWWIIRSIINETMADALRVFSQNLHAQKPLEYQIYWYFTKKTLSELKIVNQSGVVVYRISISLKYDKIHVEGRSIDAMSRVGYIYSLEPFMKDALRAMGVGELLRMK